MQDSVLVAECDALEELVHKRLDRDVVQLAPIGARVHVFLQIPIHILKNEHEFVLRVDHIVERDDTFMLEFFHQRNLSNSRRRTPFLRI